MGYANPQAMLREMPSPVLTEWHAYFMYQQEQEDSEKRRQKDARDTTDRAKSSIRGDR